MENVDFFWKICNKCKGQGKRSHGLSKKVKQQYLKDLENHQSIKHSNTPPILPKGHQHVCKTCYGTGLVNSKTPPLANEDYSPTVAIIGGGIGGMALAVACLHREIPFTLYERDSSFNSRSQGYGLTLQQASKAISKFGINSLKNGIISTRHLVHNTDGKLIGEWGARKWIKSELKESLKNSNIHIARQSLRLELFNQVWNKNLIKWGHQLTDIKQLNDRSIEITFNINGEQKKTKANVVVAADGIRSTVRKLLINQNTTPLRYLGCIVILGICPLKNLKDKEHHLLDLATVFQTANGNERIYMMPYDSDTIMWQLSFPMTEKEAKKLSSLGPEELKKEAVLRTNWHKPIPEIISVTSQSKISGYPVYDRELLTADILDKCGQVTLIGDAAHPMSPFKGQGANQALLDALSLANQIKKECRSNSNWKKIGIRKSILTKFETEMIERSKSKVKDSAQAASLLHSKIVLDEVDKPRGYRFKR
ncbi:2-polyprenyl-6-methoxyphenol hydroxylase-like FAD-dependent oxidoreductase [Wenyingzhuangia heitensis]|uniref:2-polyprenyl-6-methoxyphenol hydroxylase-like FAD-dependent oxidoreductase n=1 Tax=Wenyingzhuangia heitensis TaxID=1487859 RepID=A0ABX0UBJ9_9FLAO|nr:FAD-dependent monooxygenase [Wenyingzhuangia heitensis]NIJ46198.1 2-polyprenyl-6-methoxyphenol hydroxylase-like FAD-dependent oxidoreductase [Wenyingzhuangia heitensis]